MLDALEAGEVDGVLVYNLDRLHRKAKELEAFIELCQELRLTAVASVEGDIDLTSADGQFHARILGAVHQKESDDKSRRIRRKHEELALRGKVSGGGSRPYGFEKDRRTLRLTEAAIVKECARRFLAGESLRAITIDLNRRGVPAAAGGAWSQQSMGRMLGSGRISGEREHNGEIVATAEWPAIISAQQGAQIRRRLHDPSRRTTTTAVRRYLLAGLLSCHVCGERLVARPRAGGKRRYACATGPGFAGCGATYINADEVEWFITGAVLSRLDSPELAATIAGRPAEPEAQPLLDQLAADQALLEELATACGNREITLAELRAARTPIEQRMTVNRKKLNRLNRDTTLDDYAGKGEELRASWDSFDLSKQHTIVASVLDHVTVGPGRRGYNRFDESRLSPVWRA
jgi:hypothetical protein